MFCTKQQKMLTPHSCWPHTNHFLLLMVGSHTYWYKVEGSTWPLMNLWPWWVDSCFLVSLLLPDTLTMSAICFHMAFFIFIPRQQILKTCCREFGSQRLIIREGGYRAANPGLIHNEQQLSLSKLFKSVCVNTPKALLKFCCSNKQVWNSQTGLYCTNWL